MTDKKQDKDAPALTRRGLLGTLTATSVAPLLGTAHAAGAAQAPAGAQPPSHGAAMRESAPVDTAQLRAGPASAGGRPASDYMVDVLRCLNVEYMTTNAASSLRGLHESIINYGKNRMPELITVLHEEIGAAMAHGYFKASGRPMATMVHGAVGTQHASMAVYNAWCDRVPMYLPA